MKDYRVNKKNNNDYIVDVTKVKTPVEAKDGKKTSKITLNIKFADGKVFQNIRYDEGNVAKITSQLDQQAEEGIQNLDKLTKRRNKSGYITAGTLFGTPILCEGIAAVASNYLATEQEPAKVAIAAGVITLLGVIPCAYHFVKNSQIVSELKKLKYRNDHRDELDNASAYENAFVGLSPRKADFFSKELENGLDPYTVLNIDAYTENDLKTIVDNIEREKTYQFTYAQHHPSKK